MRAEILNYGYGPEGRLYIRARVTREDWHITADGGRELRNAVRVMTFNLGPWPGPEHTDAVVLDAAKRFWPKVVLAPEGRRVTP